MTQHRHSFSRYLTSVALVLYSGLSYASNPTSVEAADSQTKPALEWCLHHLPPRHSYLPGQQPSGIAALLLRARMRGIVDLCQALEIQ